MLLVLLLDSPSDLSASPISYTIYNKIIHQNDEDLLIQFKKYWKLEKNTIKSLRYNENEEISLMADQIVVNDKNLLNYDLIDQNDNKKLNLYENNNIIDLFSDDID